MANYMSVEEYAARTRQSASSVYRLIRAGRLRVEKFGRLLRIVVDPVDPRGPVVQRAGKEVLARG